MEILIFLKIIKRHWKLVAIVTLLGGALGFYLNTSQEKQYEAAATLQITLTGQAEQDIIPDVQARKLFIESLINVATSDASLKTLADQTGLAYKDRRDLRQTIRVSRIGETEFLEILARSPSKQVSVNLANRMSDLLAKTSTKFKQDQLLTLLQVNEGQLKASQADYNRQLAHTDDLINQYDTAVRNRQNLLLSLYNTQLDQGSLNFKQAQKNFEDALKQVPLDAAQVELAKTNLISALDHLDKVTQLSSVPYDQTPNSYELALASDLTNALESSKAAREKVDNFQNQSAHYKQIQQFISDQNSGVAVTEAASQAYGITNSMWLYLGLPLGGLLGLFLAVLVNFFDRGLETITSIVSPNHPTKLFYIPLAQTLKLKSSLTNPASSAQSALDPLPDFVLSEEINALVSSVVARYYDHVAHNSSRPVNSGGGTERVASLPGPSGTLVLPAPAKIAPLKIVLTSADPHPLSPQLAIQLSVALARAKYRVLLVDFNDQMATLTRDWGLISTQTLTSGVVNPTSFPNLGVLVYKPNNSIADRELSISGIEPEFEALTETYEIVICNAPLLSENSPLFGSTGYFNQLMLVTSARKAELTRSAQQLRPLLDKQTSLEWVVVDQPSPRPLTSAGLKWPLTNLFQHNIVKFAAVILGGLLLAFLINRTSQPKEALIIITLGLALPGGLILTFNPRLSLWTLLAFANFLFFLNRFAPEVPMGLGLEALILAGAVGTLFKANLERRRPHSNLPQLLKIGLIVYSLYAAFQIFNPAAPGLLNRFYALRWLLLPVLLPWLTSVWLGNGRDIRRFFLVWLGLVSTVMVYGIWQQGVPGSNYRFTSAEWDWLSVNPQHILGDTIRIFSTLGSADAMGMYMVIAIILSLGLLPTEIVPSKFKLLLLGLIPLALVVMLWTLTRSAYAGLPIGLIVVTLLTRNRWLIILTSILFSSYVFLSITGIGQSNTYIARFFTLTQIENDDSYQVRQEIQDRVIQKVFTDPFGSGSNTTGEAGSKSLAAVGGDQSDDELAGTATDNYYLRIGLETGWLGILAFLFLIGCVLGTFWQCFSKAKSSTARYLLAIFLAVLGALLFGSWANNYFQYPPITQLFFMSLGLLGPLAEVSEADLKPRSQPPGIDPWAVHKI